MRATPSGSLGDIGVGVVGDQQEFRMLGGGGAKVGRGR